MDDAAKPLFPQEEGDDFPPPRRVNPLAILGIIALIVIVIGGGIFAVTRIAASQGNTGIIPTPTLIPGSNLFYVQTTPGWGMILIDGQPIAHPPTSSDQAPLVLSAGVHQVVWRGDPFAPQQCALIVPP